MSPEIAQRLLAALEDLTLNTTEAMRTGGWVPTPLQQSFWEAMSEAMEAARQAKAAPQVAQPLTDEARPLIEDMLSAMEYHVEQTRPVHSTTTAIEAAREFLRKASQEGGAA